MDESKNRNGFDHGIISGRIGPIQEQQPRFCIQGYSAQTKHRLNFFELELDKSLVNF